MTTSEQADENPLATAECKVCGEQVARMEAPLHIEDHVQRGDLFRVGIDWNYDPSQS